MADDVDGDWVFGVGCVDEAAGPEADNKDGEKSQNGEGNGEADAPCGFSITFRILDDATGIGLGVHSLFGAEPEEQVHNDEYEEADPKNKPENVLNPERLGRDGIQDAFGRRHLEVHCAKCDGAGHCCWLGAPVIPVGV